jgi:CBS domain containing-hemolysin-like protein
MEDLLEEIVGEIRDEGDEEEIAHVREVPGHAGEYDVEANTSVDELRSIGVDIGEDGGETVGGWVVRHIGRLPRAGDRVRMGTYDAEVRAIRRRRIVRVRLYPRAPTIRPPAAEKSDVEIEVVPDRDDRTNP